MKKVLYVYIFLLCICIIFKGNYTIEGFKEMIQIFRSNDYRKVNLNLFDTIYVQINTFDKWAIRNLLGNTLPFIGLGILFALNSTFNKYIFLVSTLLLILLLEFVQYYFVIGIFDIDDIFLNYLSSLLGYIVIKITVKFIF